MFRPTLKFVVLLSVLAATRPFSEHTAAKEPVTEDPVAKEPVAKEPVAKEPVAKEPVAKEPVTAEPYQYEYESVTVRAASSHEPILQEHSVAKALDYLEKGALAWTRGQGCVSCHTTGAYLLTRPALTPALGEPSAEIRQLFIKTLKEFQEQDPAKLKQGITPTQTAYLAGGLAAWDAHVTKVLSAETQQALSLMFRVQSEDGSFGNEDCWPPHESSSYYSATVAATAAATAPGYLPSCDAEAKAGYQRLIEYLRITEPPHDYARLQLLWTSTHVEELIDDCAQRQIVDMIFQRQRPDGGWSIRTFAAPEQWGSGNRAAKLRGEADFENPPSDGHQTGLALVVLRDAGIAVDDPRIQRGIQWLKDNQRESGRWWTRSLNTDEFHFITYSGTIFPLLALAKTNELPRSAEK